MKVMLLVNPYASGVDWKSRMQANSALLAGHDLTTVETTKRDDATGIAAQAAEDGFDVVAVLGGDGTLNEAANGLAGTDTALAPLPGGSTNVFARTLGLPNDPIEATGALLAALDRDAIAPVGLGSVNGRYFLFHVGMGFDAAVVKQVERRAALKRYAGHPLFVYAAFATWFRHYDTSRPRMSVHLPDGTTVDDSYLTLCLNTNPYTFLGNRPLNVAPDAGLDRGLAVMVLRTLSFGSTIAIALSALGSGDRARAHPRTAYYHDLTALRVEGHGPFPYQVDGDYLGEVEHLDLRHEPDVLRLVLP